MKNAVYQYTKQSVNDDIIEGFIEGNIAEHLIQNAQMAEFGYYFYLSSDEITEFETSEKRRHELINEVEAFINENFDFDAKEFNY